MTYNQHPVCRREGCSRPAADADCEVDRGFCDQHQIEVRALRLRLAPLRREVRLYLPYARTVG